MFNKNKWYLTAQKHAAHNGFPTSGHAHLFMDYTQFSLYRRLPFSHWRSFEPKMAKVGRIRTRPFENNACMGAHIKKTQHYGSRMHQHSHVELALAKATKTTFKIASRTSW